MRVTPLVTLDMGLTPKQVSATASAAARSVLDGAPRGSMRVSLTPAGTEQLVVPLRLFAHERERQQARALTRALAALFRALSQPVRGQRPSVAAIAAFEQHGFTAAGFSTRLAARTDTGASDDPFVRLDAVAIVVGGVTEAMPPARLALSVLTFALDTPAAAHSIGPDQHVFDAYARVVLHTDVDGRGPRATLRAALLDPLAGAGHVQKSAAAQMSLAYESQVYLDENKLFAEILAPTVMKMALIVLSALPVGWLGRAGALIFQALIGFFQFLQSLFDAAEDGSLSQAEKDELRWEALGIIPFLPIQLLVGGRALVQLGGTLLEHVVDGVRQLLLELPMRAASAQAGFDGFCVTDPEYALFIPDGFQA